MTRYKHCSTATKDPRSQPVSKGPAGGINQDHRQDLEKRAWEGALLVAANLAEDVKSGRFGPF